MSVSLKVIFNCNHIVTTKNKLYGEIKMTRSFNAGFPDKLPANIDIIRIDSIKDLDGKEFSKYIDYDQKVSTNILEWINPANNPLLGEEYCITALYMKTSTHKFEASECTRCTGNGWFADILSEDSKLIEGRSKLAQDFIKILFTENNSDNYGSRIRDVLAKNVYDESLLAANISSSISECTEKMKKIQQSLISKGVYISEDELLDNVIVNSSLFDREDCTCYVKISILNMKGEKINFTFKID